MQTMITLRTTARFADNFTVAVGFCYATDHPYELRMTVGSVSWVFSRDIVSDALENGVSGLGDVRMYRNDDHVSVTLDSPNGRATFTLPLSDLAGFMSRVVCEVPSPEETVYPRMEVERFLSTLYTR